MKYLQQIKTVVWKDLKVELRTKDMLASMIVFALLVIVIFAFVFDPAGTELEGVFPGVMWVIFIFSGLLCLNRSFMIEKYNNSIFGLILCPVDKSVIYFGKLIANLTLMFIIEAVALFFLMILFGYSIAGPLWQLVIVIFLGTFGFVAIGTFLAALTSNIDGSEVLLPVILLPMIVPLIIGVVELTAGVVEEGAGITEVVSWLNLIIVYDLIFTVVPFMLFDFLMEV
ncbi:heme exporter protein CcmB [Natroniella sp. ANB-PHB2]|uniref:heme exporter protein CcmB n=1 Tax=Natroniella sp. ANB-PHB2 TaxID=3384444 RepID=UPI0038D4F052